MTYEVIEIESNDADRVHVLTGTIGEIYIDDSVRTADVTIDDYGVVNKIPIFYHCQDSETATEGNPFIEGDEVIIVNSGDATTLSADNMKIIGFKDGLPRECGFQFKFTRGDGTLITEDSGLLSYIQLYNSSNILLLVTEPVYNTETEYWEFNLADLTDADKDGYWIDYKCEDGILTQYPYRYKSADKDQVEDLIPIGAYEDIIPYWKTEFSYVNIVPGSLVTCPDAPYDPAHSGSGYFVMAPLLSWAKRYNVKSSVPYQVRRRARDVVPSYINIVDHFFFSIDFTSTCCNEGSGCKNSGNTTTGDISSALITGGELNVSVTRNNEFDETVNEIVEGSLDGQDHDIILTNTTSLTVSTNCIQSGACSEEGNFTGNLRSLSGRLSLIEIGVVYDY